MPGPPASVLTPNDPCISSRFSACAGALSTEPFGYFSGWEPNTDSKLFRAVFDAHKVVTVVPSGAKYHAPEVYSVHAGLECGPIMQQYPDLHAVSIGPLSTFSTHASRIARSLTHLWELTPYTLLYHLHQIHSRRCPFPG